ncbi:aspartate-semialdehyde dehydrogenase [Lelliottia amnigena]|nr:aspartate-semialdehyde dehydrogenase [Lelliottia amnigena]
MKNVGFIGWRGMVGSVLMQRMVEERDFDAIRPVFFSTSSSGKLRPRSAARLRARFRTPLIWKR